MTEDEAAIGELLTTLGRAFRDRTTAGLDEIYTEDADWTNAFGTTRRGRGAIIDYLSVLFNDEHFAAGRMIGAPTVSMRFPVETVAVVKTGVDITGQQDVQGATLPIRRNHSLKVLIKDAGRWRIASEIYMDARTDHTLPASS